MLKMKKLFSVVLAVAMVLAIGTTALASEPSNVIYIDATQVSANELETLVLEAQDGVNTVVVSWGEATAIIAPIDESEVAPRFNLDKTYSLTTTTWTYCGNDYPIFENNLKVTNKTGNPGPISIQINYPEFLEITTVYYWGLSAGYYTTFSLTTWASVNLYLAAYSVDGDYKITAKCS